MMRQSHTSASLDLAPLLRPVTSAEPCGRDLEYSAEHIALENAVREPDEPSVQNVVALDHRDWSAIQRQARGLLEISKDLRVACVLARSLLHTDGLLGFCSSLIFNAQLVERYWSDLYPRLDADPVERLNCLRELWNPALMAQLRSTELVSVRGLGAFSVHDVLVAKGLRVGATTSSPEHVLKALELAEPRQITELAGAIGDAAEAVQALARFVDARVGASGPLDPARLTVVSAPDDRTSVPISRSRGGILDLLAIALSDHLPSARAVPSTTVLEIVEGGGPAMNLASDEACATSHAELGPAAPTLKKDGELRSRGDVLEALDQICKYYERAEPSSPVPLLLQRARRLATMNFVDIVRELADKGLPQVEAVAGREVVS